MSDTDEGATGLKRGVLYLRVSGPSQVATDYDPEGLSIPAQRAICQRKAEQLGIEVVDEFVELGRTGTSMDKRPEFQRMLQRIRSERDVEYVIVYKLSRLNRNRVDDVYVLVQLRAVRVALVSATENIDETPEGQLMHGVLASFNEFRSAADGADIRLKLRHKATKGGTIGRAPLGYLNVKEELEDRSVSAVAVDPERGPLVRQGFELYASGEYALSRLQEVMSDLGLRTRSTRRWPDAVEVSINKWHQMLRDPYYMGVITYKGEQYQGRHQALVDADLFARVQDVLAARSQRGGRDRVHFHYLKSLLFCDRCQRSGQTSRLVYTQATGKGGTYAYYLCRGRQDGHCDLPYQAVVRVEVAVAEHYDTLTLPDDFAEHIRQHVASTIAEEQATVRAVHEGVTKELRSLDAKEERLLDLAADGDLPRGKIKARLQRIETERRRLQSELTTTSERLAVGAQVIESALSLLQNVKHVYEGAPDQVRGLLNQTFFERIFIDEHGVADSELSQPFRDIVQAYERAPLAVGASTVYARSAERPDPGTGALGHLPSLSDVLAHTGDRRLTGSSAALMAEDRGFEPLRA